MAIRRILIAVDAVTLGTDVLPIAGELARCTGAELAIMSVADVRSIAINESSPPPEVTATKMREDAKRLLEHAALKLNAATKPLFLVREGFPDKEIVAAALEWHADMLVMGTHGRIGLAHVFKGSVAESVLHHAPCPVLVVKMGSSTG